ncbi:hypothetical protein BHU09_02495 [Tannerella sp. oral taxon 808]|nr:hypothetical protein BHU09_02495 [Tannerella sp. oral taxon 808]
MTESIHIKNFGPLRDVKIDDIKPLTVLIGDSASGKSTLMKVVALMRYIYKRANIYSYLKNADVSDRPRSFINLIGEMQPMLTHETKINYTVHMPNGGNYTHLLDRNGIQFDDIGINKADMVFFKEAFVAETRSIIPTWSLYGARFPGADLGYYFNETFRDFSEATDRIKEQSLDYIGMKMEVQITPARKHFLISSKEGSGGTFELENASSGIQTSAPLMTIVRYFAHEFSFTKAFRRSVLDILTDEALSQFRPEVNLQDLKKYIHLYIEEPELSLDPQTQCLFVNDLIRQAFYRGSNKRPADGRQLGLMFATHSPYILNHLNVLLRASYYEQARKHYPYIEKDEIAVYQLENGTLRSLVEDDEETGERIIDTYRFSDSMEWILDKYESID